jgi:hypothetical protein
MMISAHLLRLVSHWMARADLPRMPSQSHTHTGEDRGWRPRSKGSQMTCAWARKLSIYLRRRMLLLMSVLCSHSPTACISQVPYGHLTGAINVQLKSMVEKKVIRCKYAPHCSAQIEIGLNARTLKQHEAQCAFASVCDRCHQRMPTKAIVKHRKEECAHRQSLTHTHTPVRDRG